MGNRVITADDRARVAQDIQYLKDNGATVKLLKGLTFRVTFHGQLADYWPLNNMYKVRKGNRSYTALRSQNPPQRLLDQLARNAGVSS